MDNLSQNLKVCNTGCIVGNLLVNHIMYADDLVVLSPSSAGLQQLLNVCFVYDEEHDIKYNAAKSVIMICRTKEDKSLQFPVFKLSDNALYLCNKVKYLGHILTDQMTDDDTYRQCRMLYAQANILLRKFGLCTKKVKLSLFRVHCTPPYTAHLWSNYNKVSFQKLQVAYNDTLRRLMKWPRWNSASEL